jgi:flagellar hook assembly protein FlgD
VLPLTKEISLRVYDVLGKEVRTLINNEQYGKGSYTISWNGRDNFGRAVASGTYFCKLTTGNVEKTMKMMVLK